MVIIQSLRDQPSQFYRGTFFNLSKTNLVIIYRQSYRPKEKVNFQCFMAWDTFLASNGHLALNDP